MTIPKTIIQTWSEPSSVSAEMHKAINSWKELNPEYDHILMYDEDCREFLYNNFTEDVLLAFDLMPKGAGKADLFRYCYLYTQGGVYVDVDNVCLKPLDEWLPLNKQYISVLGLPCKIKGLDYDRYFDVHQSFIASTKHHAINRTAINLCKYNILNGAMHNYVPEFIGQGYDDLLTITGPRMLAQAVFMCDDKSLDSCFTMGDNGSINLPVRILLNPEEKYSYGFSGSFIVDEDATPVIQCKYEGYNTDNHWMKN
mgnify:FL=1